MSYFLMVFLAPALSRCRCVAAAASYGGYEVQEKRDNVQGPVEKASPKKNEEEKEQLSLLGTTKAS